LSLQIEVCESISGHLLLHRWRRTDKSGDAIDDVADSTVVVWRSMPYRHVYASGFVHRWFHRFIFDANDIEDTSLFAFTYHEHKLLLARSARQCGGSGRVSPTGITTSSVSAWSIKPIRAKRYALLRLSESVQSCVTLTYEFPSNRIYPLIYNSMGQVVRALRRRASGGHPYRALDGRDNENVPYQRDLHVPIRAGSRVLRENAADAVSEEHEPGHPIRMFVPQSLTRNRIETTKEISINYASSVWCGWSMQWSCMPGSVVEMCGLRNVRMVAFWSIYISMCPTRMEHAWDHGSGVWFITVNPGICLARIQRWQ